MATGNDKVTISAPLATLDDAMSILGKADPQTWNQLVGGAQPNASAGGQPTALPLQSLVPFRRMVSAGAPPEGTVPAGPPMRQGIFGRPAPATDSAEPSNRSFLGRAGEVLGKVGKVAGEVAGTAFAPQIMPYVPGTDQYKAREERAAERKALSGATVEHLGAESELERAQALEKMRGTGAGAGATVESGGQAFQWNPETGRYDIPIGSRKSATGKPDIVTTEGGKMWTMGEGGLQPLMTPGGTAPAMGTPNALGIPTADYVPSAPIQGEQATANVKEPAEKTPSDVNAYIDNWLKQRNLPNTPENWAQAHQAYTKETKVDPGVIRIEALGETRGMPVTLPTGETVPMNWNTINRQPVGSVTAPAYNPEVQAAVTGGRSLAPKNVGTQVQSYGTFIRHTGDLYSAIDTLKNTDAPLMNKSINWMRNNSGDPKVKAFLAKLDPVRKEFESFLLNNRALYEDDRRDASQIIDENASPAQMYAVLPSLIHTGTARLEETNAAYRRATGKDIPDLVTPEAQEVFKRMKVAGPTTGGTQTGGTTGGSDAVSDAISKFRAKQKAK